MCTSGNERTHNNTVCFYQGSDCFFLVLSWATSSFMFTLQKWLWYRSVCPHCEGLPVIYCIFHCGGMCNLNYLIMFTILRACTVDGLIFVSSIIYLPPLSSGTFKLDFIILPFIVFIYLSPFFHSIKSSSSRFTSLCLQTKHFRSALPVTLDISFKRFVFTLIALSSHSLLHVRMILPNINCMLW